MSNKNVLVIVVDSLRADRCYGDDRECRTPNLDALRAQSTSFTNAFSVASTTTVCTASLLTGTYPVVHGVHTLAGRRLRADLPTVAERFAAAGYHTWAEATGPLEAITGLDRGFQQYRHRDHREWLDTKFGDEVRERLQTSPEPWFGYLHLWEVHYPRRVPRRYHRAKYGRLLYDRSVSALDEQLGRVLEALPENTIVALTGDHGEFLPDSIRKELVIRLKRPTAWLKRRVPGARSLRRRLMPVVLGGANKADSDVYRTWLGHGYHVYEPLIHVPLIIRAPGVAPEGLEVSSLVSHVDVVPTLLAAAGISTNGGLGPTGVDVLAAAGANGNGRPPHDAVFLQATGAKMASTPERWLAGVRTDRYKYVRGMSNAELPVELYDLEADPEESRNLADEHADVRADMERLLTGYVDSADDEARPDTTYSPEEEAQLEERLRALGYID